MSKRKESPHDAQSSAKQQKKAPDADFEVIMGLIASIKTAAYEYVVLVF